MKGYGINVKEKSPSIIWHRKLKGYGIMNLTEKSPSAIWYLKGKERILNKCHREKSVFNMIFKRKWKDMEWMSQRKSPCVIWYVKKMKSISYGKD